MIKPVFISEFENIDNISNDVIIFNEDNFLDYTFDSSEDITIYVKSNDAKSFLSLVDIDSLDPECFSELSKLTDSFIRCMSINKVFCPQGIALYKKSEKKNGIVRYCNKHQCRICQNKCFDENGKIPYKEVDFSKRVRYKIKK